MTDLARMRLTLCLEEHGRLGGRDRLASVIFPNGSVAVLPCIPALIGAVAKRRAEMERE